jgi:predicted MPP superfamily phosphohydrolase
VRLTTLPLPGWPAEDANLRVALLGDLHTGSPWNGLDKLRTIVQRTNEAGPHLVLLLGDYLSGAPGGQHLSPEQVGAVLAELRAPLGVYAVLGNHDYGFNGPRVRGALSRAGVTVLEDEAVRIGGGGGAPGADAPFWLVGVTDLERAPHDLWRALAMVTDDAPVILFMHNPDLFPEVPARVTLTLAAHTHGGQVRLPFIGRPIVPSIYGQRYAAGYVVEEGRHLFVNTGLGTSIIPVRFLVPPLVDILELRPEEKRPRPEPITFPPAARPGKRPAH